MLSERELTNRMLLRARDAIDRSYRQELSLTTLAGIAGASRAHFVRSFKETFGETPHRYLQRRRIERAMFLLRTTELPIAEVCMEVGFTSLGTFGRTFRDIVGEAPTVHRARGPLPPLPGCFIKTWARPSTFGEARP